MKKQPYWICFLLLIACTALLITFQYTTSSVSCNLRFTKSRVKQDDAETQISELTAQLHAAGIRPLPKGFTSNNKVFNFKTCIIPKYIHQTWKTNNIPFSLSKYVRSWIEIGGVTKQEYFFWTDQTNRHFIATRFPNYLNLFDQLPQGIMRADLIRYFILYEFGGMYVDLDFSALQSLDTIWSTISKVTPPPSLILGQEPVEHAQVLYKQKSLVCNAIMFSCPGHPFWLELIDLIAIRFQSGNFSNRVLKLTGPMVVQAALDARRMPSSITLTSISPVYLAPPNLFYPDVDYTNENLRYNCNQEELEKRCKQGISLNPKDQLHKKALLPDACERRKITCTKMRKNHFNNKHNQKLKKQISLATHHWKHSWLPGYDLNQEITGNHNTAYSKWKKKCSEIDILDVTGTKKQYQKVKEKCGYIEESGSSRSSYSSSKYHSQYSKKATYSSYPIAKLPRSSVPKSCDQDRLRFCKQVQAGKGRTHNCLRDNYNKLSDKCKSKIKLKKIKNKKRQ